MRVLKGTVEASGTGQIEGMAAGTGNIDRQRDVLAPGCFAKSALEFAKSGLLMQYHKWDQAAIGTIEDAKEVERGLFFRGEFFDDDESQRVRKYCQTMQAKGRKVGISIGFAVNEDSVTYHRTGADLAEAAEKMGIQVAAEVAGFKGGCFLVREVTELYEASVVTVPANPHAFADTVKHFLGGDGAYAGLSLDGHAAAALSAVRGVLSRIEAVKSARDAGGRVLSAARLAELDDIAKMVAELKSAGTVTEARRVALAGVVADLALAGVEL